MTWSISRWLNFKLKTSWKVKISSSMRNGNCDHLKDLTWVDKIYYYFSTMFLVILIGFISKQWSVKWNNGNIATSVSTRWMWWKSSVILSVPQLGGFLSSAHRQTVWSKDKVSSGNMGIHNWKYNHTKIPIISESILSDFLRWDWLF